MNRQAVKGFDREQPATVIFGKIHIPAAARTYQAPNLQSFHSGRIHLPLF
jgi:hypothetical protein